jgi:hypothetical protein
MSLRIAALIMSLMLGASIAGPAVGRDPSLAPGEGLFAVQYGNGGWTTCAREGGFCSVPYPATVRFGANGRYVAVVVTGGVQCSTDVFGDPIVGTVKHCDFQTAGFAPGAAAANPRYCAAEGQFCAFSGSARVVYGVGDRFTSGFFINGTLCDNRVFGDPALGQKKACYILP